MIFFFSVGEQDPCEVYIVVDGKPVFYKRCETPEIARAVVDGQNKSRGERLKLVRTTGTF